MWWWYLRPEWLQAWVVLDCELSMRQHVGKLPSIFFFTCVSSGGCSIRRRDNVSFLHSSYHALTSTMPCLLACQLAPLQCVLNAAAWFVAGLPARAHITDTMRSLHRLPVLIGFVTSSVLWCTLSITALVYPTSQTQLLKFRRFLGMAGSDLRTPTPASQTYLAPEQNSERAFSVAGPWEWNALPVAIRNITEVSVFKCAIQILF